MKIIYYNDNTIYFAKIKPDAKIPSKRFEDGAMDVYACFDEDNILLKPNEIKLIPTGICSAFSSKYRIVFQERGSTGMIGLKVNAGLIDSGYRGEWFVCLNNTSSKNIYIDKTCNEIKTFEDCVYYPYSKAICQCKVQEVPIVNIKEINKEMIMEYASKRGEGSLGSSNK